MHIIDNENYQSPDALETFAAAEADLKRKKRRQILIFTGVFVVVFAFSIYVGEVSLTEFIKGLPSFFNYFYETLPNLHLATISHDVSDWYWGIDKWLLALWDTVLIAFLSTLFGFIFAFLLCFPASRNLNKSYAIYFLCRRLMEIARSVPELVWALIFVFSFGIGPFPGVLAITVHSMGALGKLFSEINEKVDLGASEGVLATGGNWFQVIRFAVVPQVFPVILSNTLYYFESNTRSATILGIVGAGGVGLQLTDRIRVMAWDQASLLIIMILVTVYLIDTVSHFVRQHFIKAPEILS